MVKSMEEITRMQDNLLLIRRTVGWTATDFGDKIGVTRQTINNIESGRNKLTKTQYIAMRSVLDAEIDLSPDDTEMLKVLLDVLIDNPQNYSEETRRELVDKANLMSPGILVGTVTRKKVSTEWMSVAGIILGIGMVSSPATLIGITAVGNWLKNIIDKNNKKKQKDKTADDSPDTAEKSAEAEYNE